MKGAKFCTKCNTWKDGSAFDASARQARCTACRRLYDAEYYQRNKAERDANSKAYDEAHREQTIARKRKSRRKCKRLALIAAIAKRKAHGTHEN